MQLQQTPNIYDNKAHEDLRDHSVGVGKSVNHFTHRSFQQFGLKYLLNKAEILELVTDNILLLLSLNYITISRMHLPHVCSGYCSQKDETGT